MMGYLGTRPTVSFVHWITISGLKCTIYHFQELFTCTHLQPEHAKTVRYIDDVCHCEIHLAGKQLKIHLGILETEWNKNFLPHCSWNLGHSSDTRKYNYILYLHLLVIVKSFACGFGCCKTCLLFVVCFSLKYVKSGAICNHFYLLDEISAQKLRN